MVGREKDFAPANPDLPKMLEQHDAALVIGDAALQVDRSRYITYDLAEEWIRFTGQAIRVRFLGGSEGGVNSFSQQSPSLSFSNPVTMD